MGRVITRNSRGFARTVESSEKVAMPIRVTAETAARLHLARHAKVLGAGAASIREAAMTGTHTLAGGGTIVQFGQRVNGIEVFRSRASVLLDADKNLVSIANGLASTVSTGQLGKGSAFRHHAEAAVANAYAARAGIKLGAEAVRDLGPIEGAESRSYSVQTPGGALRVLHATAKQVYYPSGHRLVPAYYVEFLSRAARSNENQAWGLVVSAIDGSALYQTSLTDSETYNYRVWATADKVPMDGPIVDSTPYPGGVPDGVVPANAAPIMIAMEGFNKNPAGAADPWLPTGATVTFGNNAQAYSDRNQFVDEGGVTRNDGYNEGGLTVDSGADFRADITSALTFDRTYNLAQAPNASVNQIKAAVTQLFYVNNWLHDYWYDSGFNEAAGNAQASNYGRGGAEGDPLLLEAQDSADSGQGNNANMSTFADGTPPRMQMYVWNGLPNRTITTTPAPSLTFTDGIGAASFGPQEFDLYPTAANPPAIFNDGTAPNNADACEAATGSYTGRIVIVDRGTCAFTVKIANAIAAGAAGVILINNAPGNAPVNPGGSDPALNIPVLGVSLENGTPLKTAVSGGTITRLRMQRGVETKRDGTIDNGIVAHEWGHYIHHRLVLCGSTSCGGMSEGWGDFTALMMIVKEPDTFDTNVYPMAQYASAGLSKNAAYFGIRRAPYSESKTKNPFTFKHIRQAETMPTTAPLAPTAADPSEVHNVGEIWAQAMFQGYINMIKAGKTAMRPFADTQRRMANYVVAGMRAAPTEPTFVEQRDAILKPIYMAGKTDAAALADFRALAAGFADRGLGAGAIAPPVESVNLNEAVESMATGGAFSFAGFTLDDSTRSCDNDKILDAGEQGKLTVSIANAGWETLTGSTVTFTSMDPNLTFDNGGVATLGAIEPYGAAGTATVGVTARAATPGRTLTTIKVSIANPAAAGTVTQDVVTLINYDDKANASSSDDVESNVTPTAWTPTQGSITLAERAWSRDGDATNHYWHGDDTSAFTDELLVSPSLNVSSTVPFVMNFSHRFAFEAGPAVDGGPDVYFDGGVIEISDDNGTTWKDVSTFMVDPGYNHLLYKAPTTPTPEGGTPDAGTGPSNPLAGLPGFGGESPGYPSMLTTTLNFGSQFAGKTIKVRFRIGTDTNGGAAGWDIDNVSFGGSQFSSLTNTPFHAIVANAGSCTDGGMGMPDAGPRPDAGAPDVRIDTGAPSGDAASDRAGDATTTTDAPPATDAPAPTDAARDTNTVPPYTPGSGSPPEEGCDCSVPGRRSSSGSAAILLGLLGAVSSVLRRRRRITH
jgi:hypothetical protein